MAKSPSPENDLNGDITSPIGDSQAECLSFGMRLRAAAFLRDIKQAKLADGLGVTRGTFGRYWHGERLPRPAQIFTLADMLKVDPRWLLEGDGVSIWGQFASEVADQMRERLAKIGMTKEELGEKLGVTSEDIAALIAGETPAQSAPLRDRNPVYKAEELSSGDIVELDEIDLRYGMGGSYIDGPVSAAKRQFSREWLRQITRASPEHLFWASGDGDSMEPTIRSQDVILIDRSQQTPLMGDGVWAIAWGDVGMIKRLRPMPDGTLELHSDNQLVRPATAVDGEVHIIGRVVAVVKRL